MNSKTPAADVQDVCKGLKREYGHSRLNNPQNPLDDLIFVLLSNRTLPATALKVFDNLKQKYPCWDQALSSRPCEIKRILKPSGFANIRTNYLKKILGRIQKDFSACTLQPLTKMNKKAALSYLASLPGVSDKVAKCVMMYTLNYRVLPIDVHVHRISKRLGWTEKNRADQAPELLESIIPAQCRYDYHVNCVQHGRAICKSTKPRCDACCISKYCPSKSTA